MTETIIVNGQECKLFMKNDPDGFHEIFAIPVSDPIIQVLDESYEGRDNTSYLPNDLYHQVIEKFNTIECTGIFNEDDC